jgi:hypothetical protein
MNHLAIEEHNFVAGIAGLAQLGDVVSLVTHLVVIDHLVSPPKRLFGLLREPFEFVSNSRHTH